ncbi:protein of unknown function [Azospirillum baldaniorum]|uniref:Uncharacterized protein n=1 Tax=Azospirillum baldaniorum TaxID=1064539 RepID=A0A9P1JNK6_9PROT|nr:protein of unknown function [Azospirillum baldaniorum]
MPNHYLNKRSVFEIEGIEQLAQEFDHLRSIPPRAKSVWRSCRQFKRKNREPGFSASRPPIQKQLEPISDPYIRHDV